MSYKSVKQERRTRVSNKSVKQECLTRALRNSVKQGLSYKTVTSVCQLRVSHKWVRWKMWEIVLSLFLNIRVGIRVRGLHLVSFFLHLEQFFLTVWFSRCYHLVNSFSKLSTRICPKAMVKMGHCSTGLSSIPNRGNFVGRHGLCAMSTWIPDA